MPVSRLSPLSWPQCSLLTAASQLQLSALARRNNCFARGEMCGPARSDLAQAGPGPASEGELMSLQPGKITPELTQADTPGGPRLEIVNTEYTEHSGDGGTNWSTSRKQSRQLAFAIHHQHTFSNIKHTKLHADLQNVSEYNFVNTRDSNFTCVCQANTKNFIFSAQRIIFSAECT